MCRLFGAIGDVMPPPAGWLLEGEHSLLAQSHASDDEAQLDGWGMAWYRDPQNPHFEKGSGGAFEKEEEPRFRDAAARARGPVIFAHLRKASNPMRLPRARLLGPENCQPFGSGGLLFAHNGMIPLPRETRPALGRFEGNVRGVNDSEVLFWLFARHLDDGSEPVEAYRRTVADLESTWAAHGRPEGGAYSGLNLLVARGPNELWGFCHWLGEHGTGLVDRSRPYFQMTYRADSKHAVIGSEPFDGEGGWRPLANGEFFHAQLAHGLVATAVGRALPGAGAPMEPVTAAPSPP